METSEQLRAARAMLGLTRAQLADAADVSQETIKKLESASGPLNGTTRIIGKIRSALIELGIIFIPENGGPAGIRFAARGEAK